MLLHRDVLHRDAFTQRCFCTGMLSHTEMPFYAKTFEFQRDYFTLSNFTRRCQNKQRNVCARGAFTHANFYYYCMIPDGGHAHGAKEFSRQAYAKSRTVSPQLLTVVTHFTGKGWPSTSPLCNLTSMYDDGHFVQEGCVSRHQSTLPFRSKKIARLYVS
jgi:hypothetical protein